MPGARSLCDDAPVTTAEHPRRLRRSSDRMLTGAAAGLGERWRVEPTVVRAALCVLGLVGGLGVVIYVIAVLRSDPDIEPSPASFVPAPDPRRALAIGSAIAAVLAVARSIGLWAGDSLMVGVVAAAIGVSIVWSRDRSDAHGDATRWDRRPVVRQAMRIAVGTLLLGGGVVSLADRTGGLANVGASASAIAVVVGGLAVFGAPALGRLIAQLDDERSQRIRDEEMERVSAHLHDSVLQSLVLIQRSDDHRHMTNLARRQERELRAWLYGEATTGKATTVVAAVQEMTTAIEADHDVRVEAVVVGDQPLDDAATTMLAALREAVVNAARHAGVDRVDVFVEADDAELTGFVRDTGVGFEAGSVDDGHRGIADSIVGRVRRAGGLAVVESLAGRGTEVEIRVPRRSSAGSES